MFASRTFVSAPLLTATTNNVFDVGGLPTDASLFESGVLEVTSTGTGGTWILEQSIQGSVWTPVELIEANQLALTPLVAAVTATNATRLFRFACTAPFIRFRIATTITGGSLRAAMTLDETTFTAPIQSVRDLSIGKTTQPTASADGAAVVPLYGKTGILVTQAGQIRDLTDTTPPVVLTTTTETTLIAAVASVFQDIYSLTLTNTSATGTRVDLRSTTGGTIIDSFWLPPTSTIVHDPVVPWKQAAVNTNWTVQSSVAVTDVRVSARSVRNI